MLLIVTSSIQTSPGLDQLFMTGIRPKWVKVARVGAVLFGDLARRRPAAEGKRDQSAAVAASWIVGELPGIEPAAGTFSAATFFPTIWPITPAPLRHRRVQYSRWQWKTSPCG